MYPLWIVQWDFTRRDHLETPGRVSGSGPFIACNSKPIKGVSPHVIFAPLSIHLKVFVILLNCYGIYSLSQFFKKLISNLKFVILFY